MQQKCFETELAPEFLSWHKTGVAALLTSCLGCPSYLRAKQLLFSFISWWIQSLSLSGCMFCVVFVHTHTTDVTALHTLYLHWRCWSTYSEFVFERLQEAFFALPLLLSLSLSIILLQLGGADDQVELGHGDDPGVAVRPVERDLEGDLPNEAWWKTTWCTDQPEETANIQLWVLTDV